MKAIYSLGITQDFNLITPDHFGFIDLPLNFRPAAVRVSAVNTPKGVD
jgi:hypothetical protein